MTPAPAPLHRSGRSVTEPQAAGRDGDGGNLGYPGSTWPICCGSIQRTFAVVLFNAQVDELGKFSNGGNRPGELVAGQISACNGRLVCVASDGVPLRE